MFDVSLSMRRLLVTCCVAALTMPSLAGVAQAQTQADSVASSASLTRIAINYGDVDRAHWKRLGEIYSRYRADPAAEQHAYTEEYAVYCREQGLTNCGSSLAVSAAPVKPAQEALRVVAAPRPTLSTAVGSSISAQISAVGGAAVSVENKTAPEAQGAAPISDHSGLSQAEIDAMPDFQLEAYMKYRGTSKEWGITQAEKDRRQQMEADAKAAEQRRIPLSKRISDNIRGADYGEHVNIENGARLRTAQDDYNRDIASIEADQIKEMQTTDFGRLSAQQSIKATNDMKARYVERRRQLDLAFYAEKARINSNQPDDDKSRWDSPQNVQQTADAIDAQARKERNDWENLLESKSAESRKPDALQVGAAIVAGVAVYAVAKTMQDQEAYKRMTPEQKSDFDGQKAADRKLIDEMNEQHREQDRRDDQMARDSYRLHNGTEPYWVPLPGNY